LRRRFCEGDEEELELFLLLYYSRVVYLKVFVNITKVCIHKFSHFTKIMYKEEEGKEEEKR